MEKLCAVLRDNPPQAQRPRTKAAPDRYTGQVADAINNAINKVLPLTRSPPKARRGWIEECFRALEDGKRLRRIYSSEHTRSPGTHIAQQGIRRRRQSNKHYGQITGRGWRPRQDPRTHFGNSRSGRGTETIRLLMSRRQFDAWNRAAR